MAGITPKSPSPLLSCIAVFALGKGTAHLLQLFVARMRICIALLAILAVTGCDAFPRDPNDTLKKITRTHMLRVGLTIPSQEIAPEKSRALIQALERRTNARATIVKGAAEPLLIQLRDGKLDLVIGSFAKTSPWATMVAFGPPLATRGKGDETLELKAAMPNGENSWIMLVEKTSRAVSPEVSQR